MDCTGEGDGIFQTGLKGRCGVAPVSSKAAHARTERGPECDAKKNGFFFSCLNDAAGKLREPSAVRGAGPQQTGVSAGCEGRGRHRRAGDGETGGKAGGVEIDGEEENSGAGGRAVCLGAKGRERGCSHDPNFSSFTDLNVPRAENYACKSAMTSKVLFLEEGNLMPMNPQSSFSPAEREINASIFSFYGSTTGLLPSASGGLNADVLAHLLEQERVARGSLEKEEVDSRDALLDAVQRRFDKLLLHELSVERENR